jgi:uncharacterized protein (TIGR02246 family)
MVENIEHTASNLAAALEVAWNSGDAKGFADLFAEDADFIHIFGGHGRGRASILSAHEALFAGIYRGSRVQFDLVAVRRLSQDAFIAFLMQKLDFGAGGDTPQLLCRPSLVARRLGKLCSIVFMQNTRTGEIAADALAGHPFAAGRGLEVAR